jgi:RNA-directed DNA polymerase
LGHSLLNPAPPGAFCNVVGGAISPLLANLALDGLQERLAAAFPKVPGSNAKVNFVRYADDFLITGGSREILEQEVRPLVEAFLAERGLCLSPEKTVITHVDEGFDFLGQNVRRYGRKVLTKPSPASVKAFYQGLRRLVRSRRHVDPAVLIRLLNLKIVGWGMYHRHGASKATFRRLDHLIFQLLWRWARYRHPQKDLQWIRRHYLMTVGGRQWVFFGWEHSKRGSRRITLASMGSIRIVRHVKVRSGLNAHAPEWQEYLERRRKDPAARGYPALTGSISSETAHLQRAPSSA